MGQWYIYWLGKRKLNKTVRKGKLMKNTLRITLMLIGAAFISSGFYFLFAPGVNILEDEQQIYAMIGVGVLFFIGGAGMGKR